MTAVLIPGAPACLNHRELNGTHLFQHVANNCLSHVLKIWFVAEHELWNRPKKCHCFFSHIPQPIKHCIDDMTKCKCSWKWLQTENVIRMHHHNEHLHCLQGLMQKEQNVHSRTKKNTTKMKQTDGNNNDVSFQVCEFIWECTWYFKATTAWKSNTIMSSRASLALENQK